MNATIEPAYAAKSALAEPAPSLLVVVHVVYALHAVSLCVGAWTAATVVGSFLFGWPSIIAVILNYVMRDNARGTWLESHFRWQIRTFWLALLWSAVIAVISLPLVLVVLMGVATWIVGFFVLGIWAAVRIARGWLRLNNRRTIV